MKLSDCSCCGEPTDTPMPCQQACKCLLCTPCAAEHAELREIDREANRWSNSMWTRANADQSTKVLTTLMSSGWIDGDNMSRPVCGDTIAKIRNGVGDAREAL